MKFGDYLRQLREKNQWTQPIAAEHIGIEQSYLSKLESGKSVPSDEVFGKLSEAYQIDLEDLTDAVAAADLALLKNVTPVATSIEQTNVRKAQSTHRWLLTAVMCLMIGGACLGIALVPDASQPAFHYRSDGVLKPGEDLTAFSIINDTSDRSATARQQFVNRIDQQDRVFPNHRGDSFVESVDGGKRYFQLISQGQVESKSIRKWFIAPALALLLGAFGCFFIARTK